MPDLIVQMGHCYRTSGATGTQGEQPFATEVADACVRLLHGKQGWRVRPTLADVDDYRADAFASVHCDGANSGSARGASTGYQTAEGQAFAHAWKRAYADRGWPIFRPDNYTTALAKYYGVTKAVARGTRAAMIIECGFLTSPEDRALLLGPGGADRVALAIGDALGIHGPAPRTSEEDHMYLRNIGPDGKERWAIGTGTFFVGLSAGAETDSAREQAEAGRAAAQWATTATWDEWVKFRNVDTESRELLKLVTDWQASISGQLSTITAVLQQLLAVVEDADDPLAGSAELLPKSDQLGPVTE